ncbi:MAG: hypothetical protein JNM78_17170 [Cyclobacteriaceae bacterium]|nr:hypothetical protein [Cyclobacteriaceae bacterium]
MKRLISIFFITLCIAGEIAAANTLFFDEESARIEERTNEKELEGTFISFLKIRNSVRRELTSRPLISRSHTSVKRIAETESVAVNTQYQLHDQTQLTIPVYLVKKVFLI